MQIDLDFGVFLRVVDLAMPFTARRDIVPVLTHLVFDGNQVRAYDGIQGIVVRVPWTVPEPVALPGRPLQRILRAMPVAPRRLTLEPLPGQAGARLTAGAFQAEFPRADLSNCPFPTLPPSSQAQPVPRDWGYAIGRVTFSMSHDATHRNWCGVSVRTGSAYATDNYRVSKVCCGGPDVFVSNLLLAALGSHLAQVRGVTVTPELVLLYLPHAVVFQHALDEVPPDLEAALAAKRQQLQAHPTLSLVSAPQARVVTAALDRVLQCAIGAWKLPIHLTVTGAHLLIERRAPEGSHALGPREEAAEQVAVAVTGPGAQIPKDIVVNGRLFLEAWSACPRMAMAEGLPLYFASPGRTFEHLLGCHWVTNDPVPHESDAAAEAGT